ncbi:MAG TPA: hypothetical protein VIS76_15665 [Pseudomonadales bacterium]
MRLALLLALTLAGMGADARVDLEPYLGLYVGSFETALTADPDDDLNFNPCNPATRDCAVHQDPLIDILLELSLDEKGRLTAVFYRSESHVRSGQALDLLGRGCGSSVGGLQKLDGRSSEADVQWTARFDLNVQTRACFGKLRPTSSHFLLLRGLLDTEFGEPVVEVAIDKSVASQNYLYVKEGGVERRVRMDLDNTQGSGRRARYRVCIEDDLGDFGRCVITDKELKQFGLPLPVPGGAAVNYTWWHDLYPNLKRTRDLYELTQYTARFGVVR